MIWSAIDPWAPVVPILLNEPQHQTVHLGLAGGRRRLRRNASLDAEQHQYYEPQPLRFPYVCTHDAYPSAFEPCSLRAHLPGLTFVLFTGLVLLTRTDEKGVSHVATVPAGKRPVIDDLRV